jgi:hypothetical protein
MGKQAEYVAHTELSKEQQDTILRVWEFLEAQGFEANATRLKDTFPDVFPAEKTYKLFDKIYITANGYVYWVMAVMKEREGQKNLIMLVNLKNEVWHHVMEVKDPNAITEAEMKRYIGHHHFKLVE